MSKRDEVVRELMVNFWTGVNCPEVSVTEVARCQLEQAHAAGQREATEAILEWIKAEADSCQQNHRSGAHWLRAVAADIEAGAHLKGDL